MKISYLRDFIALAEIGNFQMAAEELFISQPSLTRHIKLLEGTLGASVFDRTTRKIELNEYGKLLLPYAKEITRLYSELTNTVSTHKRSASNLVTIGSIPTLSLYNIIDILEWFKLRHPFSSIRIIEESTAKLVQMLEDEYCDFAFLRRFRNSPGNLGDNLATLTLTSDVMVALVSSSHPLANGKQISIAQLENESLLLPKGEMLYNKLMSAFNQAGFQPNAAFISSRVDDVTDMVRKGMGIALMLKASTQSISNDGIVIFELGSDFVMDISLTYLKERKMNTACSAFLESVNLWLSERTDIGIIDMLK